MAPASKKPVSLGTLNQFIGFGLRLAQVRVFQDFDDAMGDLAVSPAAFSVMEVLRNNPGLTQSNLAAAIRLDRSSVVPLLDKLEKRGVLRRQSSTTDRRHNHLFLTDAGLALHDEATRRVRIHENRITACITPAEKKTLMELLLRFGG